MLSGKYERQKVKPIENLNILTSPTISAEFTNKNEDKNIIENISEINKSKKMSVSAEIRAKVKASDRRNTIEEPLFPENPSIYDKDRKKLFLIKKGVKILYFNLLLAVK